MLNKILLIIILLPSLAFAQTTGKMCAVGLDMIPRETDGKACSIPVANQAKVYLDDKYTWAVEKGRSYTFTSTPMKDSVHVRWTGACASAGANPICVITINSETRISAVAGVPITLTAKPEKGSKFMGWSGDYCKGVKTLTCSFVLENGGGEKKVDAVFDKMPKPIWRKIFD